MLQPANTLPPEVISRIAQCFLDEYSFNSKSILPLTHMCRYWRESIISAPENWTLISPYHVNLAALSLERSKAAPLQLRLDMYSVTQEPEFCSLIIPHVHKTGTLQFGGLTTVEDFVQALPDFPRSMPHLRSLVLERFNDDPKWDSSIDPFESFSNTLRSLSLLDIPLYPFFLKLRTLTKLSLLYYKIHVPLDGLLDVLEGNRSLQSVDLVINSKGFPAEISRYRVVVLGQLQHLSITSLDASITRTLISIIPLRKGAHLEITSRDRTTELGLNYILSGISTAHLSNLLSPTFMEYGSSFRVIRLNGPNGSFSYSRDWPPVVPFAEFPVLPLTNIQELLLVHCELAAVPHPSSFPTLETLTIKCHADISYFFSALFPHPSFFRSLKILGFFECVITEGFLEELARFASAHKNTDSARLHRVVITRRDGDFPSVALIHELEKHVPVVDVGPAERYRRV